MKRIIEIVIFITILTGCGEVTSDTSIAKVKRIDISSDEKMKKSIEDIKLTLSNEKKKDFEKALKIIMFSDINNFASLAKVANNQDEILRKVKNILSGKTADEVISKGKEIIAQKSQKKITSKIEDIKQVKIGESVIIDNIEITIKNISIGKLKEKKKYSMFKVPNEDYLLVKVQLKNISKGKLITIQDSWRSSILIDNFNNNYKVIESYNLNKDNLVDTISSTRIKPKEVLMDTMIFELPLQNARSFTINVKPVFYKFKGDGLLESISSGEKFKILFNRNNISN